MPDRLDASWFSFDPLELPNVARLASAIDLFEEMGFGEPPKEVKMGTLCFNGNRCRNYVWGAYKTSALALLLLKVYVPGDETKIALIGINVTQETLTPTYLLFENEEEWQRARDGSLPSVILANLGC
jgi:hypothetical protein